MSSENEMNKEGRKEENVERIRVVDLLGEVILNGSFGK